MNDHLINDYALLADCHSAALVSQDGSIDWLTMPRFDAPAVFARLLDSRAGHWSIRPTTDYTVDRRYLPETMVHTTTFRTAGGEAVLEDAMALGEGGSSHALGSDATHTLLRTLTGRSGEVEFDLEFLPRPEYGLVRPLLRPINGGVVAQGGSDVYALTAPVALSIDVSGLGHTVDTARARFRLQAGARLEFALQYATPGQRPVTWSARSIRHAMARTARAWRSWAQLHNRYRGPWADLVQRSGLVLRGLTFQPSGAVVAAPTTSLPESGSGGRNWDYRYCWTRDAAFAMAAMRVSTCPVEAGQFLSYLVNTAAGGLRNGHGPQAVFGVRGEHDLTERVLDHLGGWQGNRPVRVGNDAWRQIQLDVSGEILDAAAQLLLHSHPLNPETSQFLIHLADVSAQRWREPDHGIWERRDRRQHFVHSKLMCWVALDRAIALADQIGATDRVAGWTDAREAIRAAIEEHGWSDRVGAYAQAFHSDHLDAAALMMPIVGYTPANSPRMRATIDAIRTHLTDERGLVYRYVTDDGVGGSEGAFVLCTFWLAHCLALAGDVREARTVFQTATSCANDLGLLAEQVSTDTGELLGNFPQAYSHIGLINAATALVDAEAGDRPAPSKRVNGHALSLTRLNRRIGSWSVHAIRE